MKGSQNFHWYIKDKRMKKQTWACCWMVIYWHRNIDKTQVLIAFFACLRWRGPLVSVLTGRVQAGDKLSAVFEDWVWYYFWELDPHHFTVVGGLHPMVSRELADVILSHEQLLSLAILACPSKRASIYLLQLPNHVSYPTMSLWSCWDCIPVTLHRPLITPISFSRGMC